MEKKIMIQRFNETMSWFFAKIKKTEKPLAKLTKDRKKTQISKIRDEIGDITIDTNESQRIIREYFENIFQ
jgi:hypothetical protein